MTYGFPFDEVKPISCVPNKRNIRDPTDTVRNDVMGNFTVTLFDNLDTFIVMNDSEGFQKSVETIKSLYTKFDIDSTVQVFETNIRVLGGLLSAHLFASDPRKSHSLPHYDGFLLRLAYDLGKRLLLAFDNNMNENFDLNGKKRTDTSGILIPFPRTNLLKGPKKVPKKIQTEQCVSGVTSLILEFSLLSRLSHDPIFEDITRQTFLKVWYSRSPLDLLPMTIQTSKFAFTDRLTGIGASVDSFYEYALKYSILFDDEQFYQIWSKSYKALLTHSQNTSGFFANVNVATGMEASEWIDSLGAFFPGLQVLAGDVKNAVRLHKVYMKLWNYYGAIPERWNYNTQRPQSLFKYLGRPYREGDTLEDVDISSTDEVLLRSSIALEWYPLRPELAESTYHLYRATKDPFYLRVGEAILKRFREEFIAPCGFGGVLDIRSGARQDRMESFVLSETLKYLYLLFDESNELNQNGNGNLIFSTEGHPFWYDKKVKEYSGIDLVSEVKKGVNESNCESSFLKLFSETNWDLQFEDSFASFKSNFYEYAQDNWTEIFVTRSVQQYFQSQGLGNLSEGQRALVDLNLYRKITPLFEEKLHKIGPATDANLVLDRDYLKLEKCQTKAATEFIYSTVFSRDPSFYHLDDAYSITLRRPEYLSQNQNLELELEPDFYDKFTAGNSVCNASPDSSIFEAVMDNGGLFHRAKISRVERRNDSKSLGLYIEDLAGFRSVFESVEDGDLDVHGEYVNEDSLKQFNCTEKLFRVLKINGYWVPEGETIWVSSNSKRLNISEGIEYNDGGVILVNSIPVENMKVWNER
ncbi:hypothetical protein FOA43_000922 [Brettanomyces nanus]|uniref:alpha-1,2-Mannosidase n=1 Tax=Eeniella nana TaxID=13502 RepID=A0A875RNG1_EENNA|nr:uncharacterized protein FOA43_000922 [Brettanomyces nanus]QPG73610.1 hypothetical protein FOA43_000922 [Brettanomyces nanus]